MEPLRKCKCGVIAFIEEDLESFEIDLRSKHGRRNVCKKCAALRARKGEPLKPKKITCTSCHKSYKEEEAYKFFRRAEPRGDLVVGHLIKICRSCEGADGYVNIGGRLVKKDIKELQKESRITTKPQEVK